MNTSSRRRWITRTSVAVIGLGFGAGLLWLLIGESQTQQAFRINRAGQTSTDGSRHGVAARRDNVVPDDPRRRFDPLSRVEFHVMSSQDASVFVLATGVQVRTPSGWKVIWGVFIGAGVMGFCLGLVTLVQIAKVITKKKGEDEKPVA